MDSAGLPRFDERMISTIVHEFNHSYVNPVAAKYAARLEKAASLVYAAVSDAMRGQAYGEWETMVNESLVRAAVARYVLAKRGPEAATEEVGEQWAHTFLWTEELFALLGEYEGSRERWKTFDAFMPRIIEYFDGLAPRIDDMVRDAARRTEEECPRIISMTPDNGSEALDPALTELVFRFDRPMANSWSVISDQKDLYPEVLEVGYDFSRTFFKMHVRLKPDHLYEFRLNSESGGAFRSRKGERLKMVRVRLRTRPEKP